MVSEVYAQHVWILCPLLSITLCNGVQHFLLQVTIRPEFLARAVLVDVALTKGKSSFRFENPASGIRGNDCIPDSAQLSVTNRVPFKAQSL